MMRDDFDKRLRVEVVWALPGEQILVGLDVDEGTTVEQAIERSGILVKFPEIALARGRVGVFGKIVELDAPLHDGDRVEIYRPLATDPKEIRRRRAKRP